MPNTSMIIRLDAGPSSDALETDQFTQQLRSRLLEQEVRAVPLNDAALPDGAKALDAATVGSLLLILAPGTLAGVVEVLKIWLDRRHGRSIEVSVGDRSVKLTGGSQAEIQRVLSSLLDEPDA